MHGFKGLDAPAIVVTDIDALKTDQAADLFYVAITRAKQENRPDAAKRYWSKRKRDGA